MKWKLVPVEPTPEILLCMDVDMVAGAEAYKALLHCAPQPPALSDERILEIHNSMFPEPFRATERANVCQFTRAIEREILGGGE